MECGPTNESRRLQLMAAPTELLLWVQYVTCTRRQTNKLLRVKYLSYCSFLQLYALNNLQYMYMTVVYMYMTVVYTCSTGCQMFLEAIENVYSIVSSIRLERAGYHVM